jgi:hypothetical protein
VSLEAPRDAWRVFAQGREPRLALADWRHNAERFFDCTVEVLERSAGAARLAIEGTRRVVVGRAREEADLRDALAAENARGGGGLYDLAERRCHVVWLVEREGPEDRHALQLAAAIASVALGPILADGELFGVRTAREKLEKLGAPYR